MFLNFHAKTGKITCDALPVGSVEDLIDFAVDWQISQIDISTEINDLRSAARWLRLSEEAGQHCDELAGVIEKLDTTEREVSLIVKMPISKKHALIQAARKSRHGKLEPFINEILDDLLKND